MHVFYVEHVRYVKASRRKEQEEAGGGIVDDFRTALLAA